MAVGADEGEAGRRTAGVTTLGVVERSAYVPPPPNMISFAIPGQGKGSTYCRRRLSVRGPRVFILRPILSLICAWIDRSLISARSHACMQVGEEGGQLAKPVCRDGGMRHSRIHRGPRRRRRKCAGRRAESRGGIRTVQPVTARWRVDAEIPISSSATESATGEEECTDCLQQQSMWPWLKLSVAGFVALVCDQNCVAGAAEIEVRVTNVAIALVRWPSRGVAPKFLTTATQRARTAFPDGKRRVMSRAASPLSFFARRQTKAPIWPPSFLALTLAVSCFHVRRKDFLPLTRPLHRWLRRRRRLPPPLLPPSPGSSIETADLSRAPPCAPRGMLGTIIGIDKPSVVGVGFLPQYLIEPMMGFTIAMTLKLSAPLATGLILVSCCPGGQASNVATYISKGNVALSVFMTI
ncbi:hypothetical protein B296_00045704 [Ensete ventricosum]|uniref:Uncharacterized protein n=1 Tax=Ensete ventricosum TaxID=4639 RepID=A0A426XJ21_ENSVE|nr:hypothetical protein B296_00045704 [Ensete ventricosum]